MIMASKLVSSGGSNSGILFSHTEKPKERGVSLEQYLIIIDEKKEYAEALAAYLNSDRDFPNRAVVLTPEEAQENVKEGAEGIFLVSSGYEKELYFRLGSRLPKVFWLTEDKSDRRDTAIYRYQSAQMIKSRLVHFDKAPGRIPVAGVFLPAGGVQQERLCVQIAAGFAETKRVLYLSFLPFGTERREENGMSELLYFARQGREALAEFLREQRNVEGNLTKLGSVRWSIDLQKVTAEDMENTLEGVSAVGLFDLVFLAIGYYDVAGNAAMHVCDLLLVPVWETEEGQGIQADFIRQLREGGENGLLRSMREVKLPFPETEGSTAKVVWEAVRLGEELMFSDRRG